jgi:RHS repeat-associated protein
MLRKHVDYDSFGNIEDETFFDETGSQIANPATDPDAIDQLFYYTGQERDEATGLQLHGRRWYDPATGRFASEDPIAADVNLYRYALNNPVLNVDPTGLYTQLPTSYLPAFAGNPLGFAAAVVPHAPAAVSAIGNAVGGYAASAAGRRARNVAEVATTFNSRNLVLPPNDPYLPSLLAAATDPNLSYRARNRGELFNALQLSQAYAYEGAYQAGLQRRAGELDSWANSIAAATDPLVSVDLARQRQEIASQASSSRLRQFRLDLRYQFDDLGRVAVNREQWAGNSVPYQGIEQLVYGLAPPSRSPHAIYPTTSPLDIVASGGAGFIQGGLRAAAGEVVDEVFANATGIPVSPRAFVPNSNPLNVLDPQFVPSGRTIVSVAAQEQADLGVNGLRQLMSLRQRAAFDSNPAAGSRFLGQTVHNQTAGALEELYGGRFQYQRVGPDFIDTSTGQRIELTTPGQVGAHQAKGGAYKNAAYSTYVLPRP